MPTTTYLRTSTTFGASALSCATTCAADALREVRYWINVAHSEGRQHARELARASRRPVQKLDMPFGGLPLAPPLPLPTEETTWHLARRREAIAKARAHLLDARIHRWRGEWLPGEAPPQPERRRAPVDHAATFRAEWRLTHGGR